MHKIEETQKKRDAIAKQCDDIVKKMTSVMLLRPSNSNLSMIYDVNSIQKLISIAAKIEPLLHYMTP